MSRRESVGRTCSRTQSMSNPPEMEFVSVAVLPPRLPSGLAPPTGLGAAGIFSWDESLNWQHNEVIDDPNRKRSMREKMGFTTQRKKANPDLPPFVMRQIPYDRWRKHYAKDANGNYRGTHAPAEDCLLKPEDVAKWRLEEPQYKADLWTRGSEVLPVYDEVRHDARAPEYYADYDHPPHGEPIYEEDELADPVMRPPPRRAPSPLPPSTSSQPSMQFQNAIPPAKTIADGKTAAQIIEEARNKPKPTRKEKWKAALNNGTVVSMLGS